jgi:hypothetical protein
MAAWRVGVRVAVAGAALASIHVAGLAGPLGIGLVLAAASGALALRGRRGRGAAPAQARLVAVLVVVPGAAGGYRRRPSASCSLNSRRARRRPGRAMPSISMARMPALAPASRPTVATGTPDGSWTIE